MKIFPIIKKIIQQEGNTPTLGAASFAGLQNIAVRLSSILDTRFDKVLGVSLKSGLETALVPESLGLRLSGIQEADIVSVLKAGVACSSILESPTLAQPKAATQIVQVTYDLTHTSSCTAAVGGSPWANPANAQGARNGTVATCANTVTTATNGAPLTQSFAAQNANRGDLEISEVLLETYARFEPSGLNPGSVRFEYSLNSGTNYTVLHPFTPGAFDNLIDPKSYDITAAVLAAGGWAAVGATFRARWVHTAAANAIPSTLSVDATHLVVTASRTDLL